MANTWNIKKGTLIVGGIAVTGAAEGDFIEVEQVNPDVSMSVGVDGETCMNEHNDRQGKATIKLMQTSAINALLRSLLKTKKGFDFMWKNPNGEVYSGVNCRFEKHPKTEGKDKVGTNEWVVIIPDLGITDGLSLVADAVGLITSLI